MRMDVHVSTHCQSQVLIFIPMKTNSIRLQIYFIRLLLVIRLVLILLVPLPLILRIRKERIASSWRRWSNLHPPFTPTRFWIKHYAIAIAISIDMMAKDFQCTLFQDTSWFHPCGWHPKRSGEECTVCNLAI